MGALKLNPHRQADLLSLRPTDGRCYPGGLQSALTVVLSDRAPCRGNIVDPAPDYDAGSHGKPRERFPQPVGVSIRSAAPTACRLGGSESSQSRATPERDALPSLGMVFRVEVTEGRPDEKSGPEGRSKKQGSSQRQGRSPAGAFWRLLDADPAGGTPGS